MKFSKKIKFPKNQIFITQITARQKILNSQRQIADIEADTNLPEIIREVLLTPLEN